MQITALLLFAGCLSVSAGTYGQKVTLTETKAPLDKVFQSIKAQTGYSFFYTDEQLRELTPVTLSVKDMPLNQVLDLCFAGQVYTYAILDKMIVVKKREALAAAPVNAAVSIIAELKGRVTNEAGEPLQGASIGIQNSNTGTFTDERGGFVLKNVRDGAVLEISFTGYQKTTVKLARTGTVSIVLRVATNQLDEVQIIAYGATSQRLGTGDVTTVGAKDIQQQPVDNPMLALEGRVPGLFIQQNTGVPGAGLTIRLQGQNSLSSGNDPLYVIDGVPYTSQLLPNISGIFGILGSNGSTNANSATGGGNPLAFISPADIESISVLKDADATSIYGSRAANGAILITTKHGKAGKTKVEVNCQDGWGRVARMMPLLNTQQYLVMRHEAMANDGVIPGRGDHDLNGLWDTTRYTNWQKVLIGGTAHYTDDQVDVSGGTPNTTFLVGVGYHKQTTVFPGDLGDEKGNVHFNISNVSTSQKFRLQLTGTYVIDQNILPTQDLTQTALDLAPDAPALRNADGSLNWAPDAAGNSSWRNPLVPLLQAYTIKTNNLIGNLVTSYEILKGLDVKLSAGYNSLGTNEVNISPLSAVAPELVPYSSSASVFGTEDINTWTLEPQLTYKAALGGGILDALVGGTVLQTNSSMTQTYALGFTSDQELYNMSAAASLSPYQPSIVSVYKYSAGFSRIGYKWRERYLLDLTARRDGSSRFGSANEFHNFGSVGGAWIFSDEAFVKSALPMLSFGKLRVSYGTTGNDQIGDYKYLPLYSPVTANVETPYQGATGLASNGLSNPYLQWELTRKLQFGLNLGIWKDRILFSGNYYLNRSSNQLQNYALPALTGNTGILTNFPALVQNNGWELTLNIMNIKKTDFSWSSSLNLTIPSNKLVSYPGLSTSTYADQYVVGQPITIVKVFHYLGVDPSTGIYQFASSSGHQTSAPNYATDATFWVNPAPKYFGGLENTLQYKGVRLDFLFQFVDQIGPNYTFGRFPGEFFSRFGITIANQPSWMLNRWQAPGDHSLVQKFSSKYSGTIDEAFNSVQESNFAYSSASFIRLKNVSLSWQFPARWMQGCHLEGIRLYAQGQNLLTLTHFKGLDPESQSILALPPLKMFTLGAAVTF